MLGHILLIEADQLTRLLLRYHLLRAGYTISESLSAVDIADQIVQQRPNLVIVDSQTLHDQHLLAPTCQALAQPNSIPVLLLASLADQLPQDNCPHHWLLKPVLASQLLDQVHGLLDPR